MTPNTDLSHNHIEYLDGINKVYSLEVLNLGFNNIQDYDEVSHLSSLPCLEQLTLAGNPLAESKDYRLLVFHSFLVDGKQGMREVPILDDVTITSYESAYLRDNSFRAVEDQQRELTTDNGADVLVKKSKDDANDAEVDTLTAYNAALTQAWDSVTSYLTDEAPPNGSVAEGDKYSRVNSDDMRADNAAMAALEYMEGGSGPSLLEETPLDRQRWSPAAVKVEKEGLGNDVLQNGVVSGHSSPDNQSSGSAKNIHVSADASPVSIPSSPTSADNIGNSNSNDKRKKYAQSRRIARIYSHEDHFEYPSLMDVESLLEQRYGNKQNPEANKMSEGLVSKVQQVGSFNEEGKDADSVDQEGDKEKEMIHNNEKTDTVDYNNDNMGDDDNDDENVMGEDSEYARRSSYLSVDSDGFNLDDSMNIAPLREHRSSMGTLPANLTPSSTSQNNQNHGRDRAGSRMVSIDEGGSDLVGLEDVLRPATDRLKSVDMTLDQRMRLYSNGGGGPLGALGGLGTLDLESLQDGNTESRSRFASTDSREWGYNHYNFSSRDRSDTADTRDTMSPSYSDAQLNNNNNNNNNNNIDPRDSFASSLVISVAAGEQLEGDVDGKSTTTNNKDGKIVLSDGSTTTSSMSSQTLDAVNRAAAFARKWTATTKSVAEERSNSNSNTTSQSNSAVNSPSRPHQGSKQPGDNLSILSSMAYGENDNGANDGKGDMGDDEAGGRELALGEGEERLSQVQLPPPPPRDTSNGNANSSDKVEYGDHGNMGHSNGTQSNSAPLTYIGNSRYRQYLVKDHFELYLKEQVFAYATVRGGSRSRNTGRDSISSESIASGGSTTGGDAYVYLQWEQDQHHRSSDDIHHLVQAKEDKDSNRSMGCRPGYLRTSDAHNGNTSNGNGIGTILHFPNERLVEYFQEIVLPLNEESPDDLNKEKDNGLLRPSKSHSIDSEARDVTSTDSEASAVRAPISPGKAKNNTANNTNASPSGGISRMLKASGSMNSPNKNKSSPVKAMSTPKQRFMPSFKLPGSSTDEERNALLIDEKSGIILSNTHIYFIRSPEWSSSGTKAYSEMTFNDAPLFTVYRMHCLADMTVCVIYFGFQRFCLEFASRDTPNGNEDRKRDELKRSASPSRQRKSVHTSQQKCCRYMFVTRDKALSHTLITKVPKASNMLCAQLLDSSSSSNNGLNEGGDKDDGNSRSNSDNNLTSLPTYNLVSIATGTIITKRLSDPVIIINKDSELLDLVSDYMQKKNSKRKLIGSIKLKDPDINYYQMCYQIWRKKSNYGVARSIIFTPTSLLLIDEDLFSVGVTLQLIDMASREDVLNIIAEEEPTCVTIVFKGMVQRKWRLKTTSLNITSKLLNELRSMVKT